MENKKLIYGEWALIAGLLLNSFSVTLMIKSNLGTSPISSVPVVLTQLLPQLSLGTWNYTFQTFVMLILIMATRKCKLGYLFSFAICLLFGNLIDMFTLLLNPLPNNLLLNAIYFAVSMTVLSFGITLQINCGVPILPLDTFTRDFSSHFNLPVKKVKTVFDLSCLTATLILAAVFLHTFFGIGIGVGTIISSAFTGTVVGFFSSSVLKRFYFQPKFLWLGRLS